MKTAIGLICNSAKRALGLLLVLSFVVTLCVSAVPASSYDESWVMIVQNDTKWTGAQYTYGTGTLRATGCGIFSLVNAVGYLTGLDMGVPNVASWAYSIGGYNAGGADGTYRFELYPYVEAKYGEQYGFTVNINGGNGWWSTVNNSTLKNHLANGGVAVAHVPNHFIALVGYNSSIDKFHVMDSYPTNARDSYPGDVWLSSSHLTTVTAMKVDWWFLISPAETNKVKAPTITASTVVDHGAALGVSWGAVTNATSYNYKAEVYQGEVSATTATTVYSGTTTSTSITVPGQASGKYMKVTVTAVGPENTASASSTVMMGPWVGSYPTNYEYVPVVDVNGSTSVSSSTVWTSAKGSSFGMTYWRAFVCSPNSDGTYTVNTIYENAASKSVSVSGTQILWAVHSGYTNYEYCKDIVVGDKLSFVGVYLDKATVRGSGYVLVNGGVPIGPDSLTVKENSTASFDASYLVGVDAGVTGSQLTAMFNEDAQYITVKDATGTVVTSNKVGTGYTVSLVVNGNTVSSYTVVVSGDLNGDAGVSSADLMTVKLGITKTVTLTELPVKAADLNGNGTVDSTDYLYLKKKI